MEEIIAVMRAAGDGPEGVRLRGVIVVLWRAGLRISEALALNETDLDPLSAIVFRINVAVRAGVTRVRKGQLDYYDASTSAAVRPVTVGPSVGCRNRLAGVPGLDLAALCRQSAAG